MPQIASREATIAAAKDGSLSCRSDSTLRTSRSYGRRSSANVVFDADEVGWYHITADFEPNLGTPQTDLLRVHFV